ncbi:MAG: HAD family hydrolase [Clostridia bacterium]|nr:HAD family hydrolase [Clostridia bacterium]
MKYDSVIFDLDGTLLDTLEDLCDSMNYALSAHNMKTRTLSEIRVFVGNGMLNLARKAVPEGTDEEALNSVLTAFKAHYADHSQDKTRPYDGITELLSALKERGIPTAVVSNKADYAVKLLMPKYFGDLIGVSLGELEGVPRKPHPDTVRMAIEKMGAHNPVYIGDSEVDVLTAKNAGIDGIFVTWGFRSNKELTEAGADEGSIVNSVFELEERLK